MSLKKFLACFQYRVLNKYFLYYAILSEKAVLGKLQLWEKNTNTKGFNQI